MKRPGAGLKSSIVLPLLGAILAAGTVLLGCASDESMAPEAEPTTIEIVLDHAVDGLPLPLDALVNRTGAGVTYSVDRLRYYVSDPVFHRPDGSSFAVESVHYRDASDPATRVWSIPGVAAGEYAGISFFIGLDEEKNVWGSLEDTPENAAMRWPAEWGDGYHYMVLEGRYAADGAREPYLIETGRVVSGGNAHHHHVEIDLPGSALVADGGRVRIDAVMDVAAWLDDPPYDFAAHGTGMISDLELQAQLRDGGRRAFDRRPSTPPEILEFAFQGFPPMLVPEDNPITRNGVLLGRMLFHDPILSGDSTLACAGCHQPARGFSDDMRFSDGIDGTMGTRNTPSLPNAGWLIQHFWDGRAASLEDQALEPVENPIEMHLAWGDAESRLQRHPSYPALFERVFGTPVITRRRVVQAIAQFERTFVSVDSRFDRWVQDPTGSPLTPAERNGFALFFSERGDCFHCHGVNGLFTDNRFHNVGLDPTFIDLGLGAITGDPSDYALFKTPSLRNVERTAPYMHDGRFQTLEEVVRHYNSGGFRTPTVDPLIRVGVGLRLSDSEVLDLVAFLRTLTDEAFLTNPAFASPFE